MGFLRKKYDSTNIDLAEKRYPHRLFANKFFWILLAFIILCIAVIVYKTAELLINNNSGEIIAENVNELIVGHEGIVTTDLQTNIKDVIEKADLYVKEYPYSDYFSIRDEKNNIKYYTLYHGIIKYGIDVEKINVSNKDDVIIIEIPPAEIKQCYVRQDGINKLDFIYVKENIKTDDNLNREAKEKAEQDLKNKAYTNREMKDSATDEAKNTITFLTKAIVGEEQKIEVVVDEKQNSK